MSKGVFVSFYLPYTDATGATIPPGQQAAQVLESAKTRIVQGGAPGVGITYSANYGQTREIEATYAAGGWDTNTNGANQAAVIHSMEELLGSPFQALRGKMRIMPITTMNAYTNPVTPWNTDVQMKIVIADLARIQASLEAGWTILGWQNQDTVGSATEPYAIGGGITSVPAAVSAKIQETLIGFAAAYPQ